MKKSTKIIASVAIAVVLVAGIVTISLFKDVEPSTPTTSFSVPSTTLLVQQPVESESFFDWDAYINSLDLSTEPESSTINPSDPTATMPSTGPNVVVSIVYPSDYIPQTMPNNTTTTTTEPTTKAPVVEMVDYKYTITDDSVTLNSYFGSDMTPVIPAEINGLPVTKIGYNCFRGTQITSVYIPDTVHMIDTGAFNSCQKLKNVYFLGANSTMDIGPSAFQNCKNLTTIKLPTETRSIGNNAFSGCSLLTQITIPVSVNEIGPGAFSGTNESFVIYGKQNSEAHAYAEYAGIKFETV